MNFAGQNELPYPGNNRDTTYTARLGDTVEMPCIHNLEEPVSVEWRREYSQLPSGVRQNEVCLLFKVNAIPKIGKMLSV